MVARVWVHQQELGQVLAVAARRLFLVPVPVGMEVIINTRLLLRHHLEEEERHSSAV